MNPLLAPASGFSIIALSRSRTQISPQGEKKTLEDTGLSLLTQPAKDGAHLNLLKVDIKNGLPGADPLKPSREQDQANAVGNLKKEMAAKRKELKKELKKMLKTRLKGLQEQYKIMHKMLKSDPKAYARYMANMAQELRKLVKEYTKINKEFKEDKDASADAPHVLTSTLTLVSAEMPDGREADINTLRQYEDSEATASAKSIESPENVAATTETMTSEADSEVEADTDVDTPEVDAEATDTPENADTAPTEAPQEPLITQTETYAVVEYQAAEKAPDGMTAEEVAETKGDIMFGKTIQEFVKVLKEKFQEIKVAHMFAADPEGRAKLNEKADKEFEKLDKELKDFVKDLEKTLPAPGTSVSVAA